MRRDGDGAPAGVTERGSLCNVFRRVACVRAWDWHPLRALPAPLYRGIIIAMKRTFLRGLVIIGLILGASASCLFAETDIFDGGVMCRTNRTVLRSYADWMPVTKEMTITGGIKVFTNGTFQVNQGKIRDLLEGQVLRPDGNLLNPDGSIMPVYDHIAMMGTNVMVFRDGEGQPLADTLTLPDGSTINPDGTFVRPANARRSRLVDGQMLTLDGRPIDGLDTIRLSHGKASVYKAGALIPLQAPNVIMGMYDGTRVTADGLVTFQDGSTMQLAEGQIIAVPGVRADW